MDGPLFAKTVLFISNLVFGTWNWLPGKTRFWNGAHCQEEQTVNPLREGKYKTFSTDEAKIMIPSDKNLKTELSGYTALCESANEEKDLNEWMNEWMNDENL